MFYNRTARAHIFQHEMWARTCSAAAVTKRREGAARVQLLESPQPHTKGCRAHRWTGAGIQRDFRHPADAKKAESRTNMDYPSPPHTKITVERVEGQRASRLAARLTEMQIQMLTLERHADAQPGPSRRTENKTKPQKGFIHSSNT